MAVRKALQWAVDAFAFLTLFFLLISMPLPTLSVETLSHTEEVVVPYTPKDVELSITLREESRDREFPTIEERLSLLLPLLENYSLLPSLSSYKEEGKPVYVMSYRINAVMPYDEIAIREIAQLADALSVRFLFPERQLAEMALERASWQPPGFTLSHTMEASCSRPFPVPIYKASPLGDSSPTILPKEEERRCVVQHRAEVLRVRWHTVYQLLQPLIPG